MKNKNVSPAVLKIESVTEFLERGGEIDKCRPSRRNQNRIHAKPKLFNKRKHGRRCNFLSNAIS